MIRPTFPHYTDKELRLIHSNNATNITNYWRNIRYIYQETLRLCGEINKFAGTNPTIVDLDANIDATYQVVPVEIFGSTVDIHCVYYSTTEQTYVERINHLQEYYALSRKSDIAVFLNKDSIGYSRTAVYSMVLKMWFERNEQNPCFKTMDSLTDVIGYAKLVSNDDEEHNEEKKLVARIMLGCHNLFLLEDKTSLLRDIVTFNHLFSITSPRLKRPIREYRNFGYTRKNIKVMVDSVQSLLNII